APAAEATRHTDAAPGSAQAPTTATKTLEFRAPLVIAADGRWSKARAEAGLAVRELHSTIDVWWFRIDTEAALPVSDRPGGQDGKLFAVSARRAHVETARLSPKGADERLRAEGIEALRRAVAETYPQLSADVDALEFADVKLLDVRRNEARRWAAEG